MTFATEGAVAQSHGRSTYDWVILIGIPPILLGLIAYSLWLIFSANLPASDANIAEAGKESPCVNESLQSSLKSDVPVTNRKLISIRAECSELMQEQADSEAKKLAAQQQRSKLTLVK